MNKEVALKWVEALKSGNYTQGKHRLSRDNKFDALGVLCDISQLTTWRDAVGGRMYFSCLADLPKEVKDWSGMRSTWGWTMTNENKPDPSVPSISRLNDEGSTFAQIADFIEENWEKF